MLEAIKEFENELVQYTNQFHINSKIKENLETENNNLLLANVELEKQIETLNDVKLLMETMKVHKLKEKKDFILNIINTALVDIFQDNIKIAIEPQESSGKVNKAGLQKFDIIFYQNDIELARNEELLISNGGGIMQVVSMLFKLLIGFIYSKNTFYMFDESFSQLSSDNRIRLSKFLQMFCEQYNFTIVVVSQVLDLDEYADIIYSVNAGYNDKGVRELVLEDTKIKDGILERYVNPGEEGYWRIQIQNFQSIKELEMVFKGYTIIRGPNNSGKSAILRALSSILYNSFNVKKYPRKAGDLDTRGNPSKKVLSTKVKLIKEHIILETGEVQSKEIGLNYKGSKVSFIIEGEEYYGKNLASDKLMEHIEALGFKYINLKEFYKNFKGNLKDQTERIASTTQYDGLFLVGSKGNETEKIFNFLFNTENITKAILKIKEDMVILAKQHEINQEKILDSTSKIDTINKEIRYYSLKYYHSVINAILNKLFDTENIKNTITTLYTRRDNIHKLIETSEKFLSLNTNLSHLHEYNISKNTIVEYLENTGKVLLQKKEKVNKIEEVIEKLREKNNEYQRISSSLITLQELNQFDKFGTQEKILSIKKRIDIISTLIVKGNSFINLNNYLNSYYTLHQEKNKIELYLEPVLNKIQILKNQNKLFIECKICSGKGFILKESK
jgi:energy-coupling factor transporter ATP-binding protein EcfA2